MKYRININDAIMREVTGREVWNLVGGDGLKGNDMSLIFSFSTPGVDRGMENLPELDFPG